MESSTLLLIAGAFIFGAVFTFIILRITRSKDIISRSDYEKALQDVAAYHVEKNGLLSQLAELRGERSSLQHELNEHMREINRLNTQLGSRTAEVEQGQLLINDLKLQVIRETNDKHRINDQLSTTKQQLVQVQAALEQSKKELDTQRSETEKLGAKFEDAFKVLAQQILDDKTKKFTESQEQNLKTLLEPLQTQIHQFRADIETRHQQESRERISLSEHIKLITQTNQTLSEQANKLTETLRLQVKQQGDWGESILEAILENSGLQKGLQYFTQQSARNDDGRTIRPDVVVKYPDQRSIIIDSKVSLVHYYDMCSAVQEEAQKKLAGQLVGSLYAHIDGLASKNYADLAQALDFVIMFVPVEPAYIAAMHADPDLWQYAYKKKILLISPANLIATLKLVKDMWRKDAVDKNAQEIAERAGKLYDKLVGFVDTFETVGAQIHKAGETWDTARKQLSTGRGNLVGQAEKMKVLDIDAKKSLPPHIVIEALADDAEADGSELKLYE